MAYYRNLALYEPATECEIRDFSNKLLRVGEKLAFGDGYHYKVEVDRKIIHPDDSFQTVRYSAEYAETFHTFHVGWSKAIPLSSSEQSVFASIANSDEVDAQDTSNMVVSPEEEADTDDIVSFLEQERSLQIIVSDDEADASVTSFVNFLNDSFSEIDTAVGFAPETHISNPEQETVDIEMLVKYGETLMDMVAREAEQSVVTRANLIIAAGVLQSCGLMHPLTIAYRGAPRSVDNIWGLHREVFDEKPPPAWRS